MLNETGIFARKCRDKLAPIRFKILTASILKILEISKRQEKSTKIGNASSDHSIVYKAVKKNIFSLLNDTKLSDIFIDSFLNVNA